MVRSRASGPARHSADVNSDLQAGDNGLHSPPPLLVKCSGGTEVHFALDGISHNVTSLVIVTESHVCV